MITAIFPGTFDPLTNGHVELVKRAATLFDALIVAVAKDTRKKTLFSAQERLAMCQETFSVMSSVQVEMFDGLFVDFVKNKNAKIILRGLRNVTDTSLEFQLSMMNRTLLPKCETLFLHASDKNSSISSTIVREIAALGGDVSLFVPPPVLKRIQQKNDNRWH